MTDEIYETGEDMAITTAGANTGIVSYGDQLMADVSEQGYFSSFPVETFEDKKKLYQARNDNELLRDYMDKPIEVVGFVIDTQTINDAEFGAKSVPCLHIVGADGTCYQSTSSGVVKSAIDIMTSFGMPDTWAEPVHVVCYETNTRNGYRYKQLRVV